MNRSEKKRSTSRHHYPPFWEKVVPIVLGVIVVAIMILVLVIFAVALGIFPGSG